jgi:hypothetical protein
MRDTSSVGKLTRKSNDRFALVDFEFTSGDPMDLLIEQYRILERCLLLVQPNRWRRSCSVQWIDSLNFREEVLNAVSSRK